MNPFMKGKDEEKDEKKKNPFERVQHGEAANAFLKKGMKKEDAMKCADEFMKEPDGKKKLKMLAEPFKKPNHVMARMDKMAKQKAAMEPKKPFGRK